ncbi:MAG TPA: G1 family glutamic endopeptidase, partial [Chloroflexota bacterium]|nr:G1 family glutamic endopeptidase [Chloroflexota bacterium]
VRDGDSWKIQTDVHPDSRLEQPGAQPAPSGSPRPSVAPRPARSGTSHNWSGYSATGGKFTGVSATLTVPQPVAGSGIAADAAWVGVGGVRSRDLIQAGTEQTVLPNGRVSYQAWIEMLPQVSHPVQLRITPGDSVTVSLKEQQENSWLISFKNNTTGQTFQTTQEYESSHSSAEWVEEAPSGRRGVLTLSNFGTVKFSNASAMKDGKTVSVADAGGRAITMIDRNDQPIAQPSQLGSDGASFSVTRVSAPASSSPARPAERPAA